MPALPHQRRAALLAAVAAAIGGRDSLGAAAERDSVPGGRGCYVVTDRTACCQSRDGRSGTDYGGQDCVPAKDGMSFATGAEGAVCQPSCWAHGECGDGEDQADRIGTCDGDAPTSWYLLGANRACRADYLDMTVNGRGTVDIRYAEYLALCKSLCEQASQCSGVEFNPQTKQCELWTRPMGFTVEAPGYECWGLARRSSPAGPPAPAPGPPAAATPPPTPVPTPAPTPAPAAGTVEQAGARIPSGADVRFYAVGTSNAAWQTWPDQLHAMLKQLGYNVNTPDLAVPGALSQPSKSPVCADASSYQTLRTPRLGMIGWSSWGFAYESKADCDDEGYRQIAGYPVSCTNAWACNPSWQGKVPSVNATALAAGVRDAHFVLISNWINDAKAAMQSGPREVCYKGADIDALGSTDITAANLKRLIRAIHAQNPDVVVLVLARYPDTQQIVYPRESTLARVRALNSAVESKILGEPNTIFVNYSFPLGENMFQTLSKVHPNCRGDKVMATSALEALFKHQILSRSLALDTEERCLRSSDCGNLSLPCCQRSALCYVAPGGGCAPYGPGAQ